MPHPQGLTAEPVATTGIGAGPKADLATLVARLVLREIDPPALDSLCRPEILEILEKLEPGCARYLGGHDWSSEDFDEAAADYCEIFVLSKKTSPFASAWLGGAPETHGPDVARRVHAIAAGLGLESGAASSWTVANLPPDHLGVLLSLAAEAWRLEPAVAEDFSSELLRPWIPAWAEACRASAQSPLYRAVSRLAAHLVHL